MIRLTNTTSLITAVAILFVACVAFACDSPRSSSAPSPSASGAPAEGADTIYVDAVGLMTKEELYSRFMNRRFGRARNAYWYGKAILKTGDSGAVDSLLAFSNRYSELAFFVSHLLAQEKVPELGPWLQQHTNISEIVDWSDIGSTLAHNGWRDSVVAEVLMDQLHRNPEARARIARAFVGMGTLEEVRTIVAINDTTSSKWLEWTAIAAQARFDVPEFNQRVRVALRDTSGLHLRELEGVELNRRHDFLPELRATLREYRDGDPDHHLIDNLEEMTAEFETLKAKGIKPGAPLDYPNTTRADSTPTR